MRGFIRQCWHNIFTTFFWCVRLAALDALGWVLAFYVDIGRALSATFTVRWDPLGRSRLPISAHGTPPRGPQTFVVGAADERSRRVVAWFYRWHKTPDDGEWRACLARFGLAACPSHTLLFETGRSVEVTEIRLGEGFGRGSRTIAYNTAALTADGQRAGPITGPTPIGGLSPARLLKDASAIKKM
jgi:hypothetical protein